MHLGGWWRLWIAASAIYAVVVVSITALSWPDVDGIAHHPSFIYRMPEPAQAVLSRNGQEAVHELGNALVAADKANNTTEATRLASEIAARLTEPIVLEMPNGYKFEVAGDTQTQDSELVREEYVRVLRSELGNQRRSVLLNAFLLWLGPVLLVCLLGMVSRWVYVGFVASKG